MSDHVVIYIIEQVINVIQDSKSLKFTDDGCQHGSLLHDVAATLNPVSCKEYPIHGGSPGMLVRGEGERLGRTLA